MNKKMRKNKNDLVKINNKNDNRKKYIYLKLLP